MRRALLILAALLVAACSPEQSGEPVIRINTAGLIGEAGLFLAYDQGYFETEGVRVELVPAIANASTDSLAQLATGGLEVATFGPTAALFNAIDRGFDIVGIMPLNVVTREDDSRGIVVRQDLLTSGRYRTPADLKGLKVGTLTTGGAGHFVVLDALRIANLTAQDIELETLPMPDTLIALANGSIDAAFLVEPFISAARTRGVASMAIPASATSLGTPSVVVFASSLFAERHPGLIERFTTALLRGQRDYAEAVASGDREQLWLSLQRHTATKDLERLRQLALPRVDPNGGYDEAALRRMQEFFLQSGIQKRVIPGEQVFDRRYVEYARARLSTSESQDVP